MTFPILGVGVKKNFNIIKGEMSTLKKLSDKICEVYDLELAEELTEIFNDIVSEYKGFIDACNESGGKLESRRKFCDVARKMYHEKCDELDKVLEEKEQAEYDRDYYEKYSKELVDEINRKNIL